VVIVDLWINDFEWSCSWVIFLFNGEQRWDLNFLIVSLGTAECLLAAMLSCFSFATPFFFLCHACLAAHTASSPVMEKRRFCSRSTSMEHQWATAFTILISLLLLKGWGNVRGSMEHLREIRPRCHGGDGLQPTGARRWKLLELVAEQFAATRPFFLIPFITTCFSHSNMSSPNV